MAKRNVYDERKLDEVKEKAEGGSITAIQIMDKIKREERLNARKEELLSKACFEKPGDENREAVEETPVMPSVRHISGEIEKLDISEIEHYIQKGEFKTLPEHMAVYLKWMEIAHDWFYKFKTRTWVMRYLMANCKDADGTPVSYYMAEKIFNDMMVFFYADKNFKKNSWLRYLAERIEMGAAMALEDNDFEAYGRNLERAAKVIGMMQVEKANVDPRLLDRRPRFFVTDAKALGVPEINRFELARQIDEMEITEAEKQRAKQDLGVEERSL